MSLIPPQTYRKTAETHRSGLAVEKPAAADVLPGTLYHATDALTLERSDGSAWAGYSGGYWTDFTPELAASAGTVTVTLVQTAQYTRIGPTIIVTFYLELTLSATPGYLTLAVPGGVVSAGYAANLGLDEVGTMVFIQALPSNAHLHLQRNTAGTGNWTAGAHTIGGTATFPVT